ncbi:MAG: DNA recombination protein RmuC [bacterium]
MNFVFPFLAGALTGALAVILIGWLRKKDAADIARELMTVTEEEKTRQLERITSGLKDSFSAISLETMSKNTAEFLKLAKETLSAQTGAGEKELETKKKLIDQTLESISREMNRVNETVIALEKDRENKFGEITSRLQSVHETAHRLQETTAQLKTALSGQKVRGQWGERMAEDILRLAGFVEGINYQKQKTLESSGSRPDYTFLLPQGLKVNMDVKFPLDNYLRCLEAENPREKDEHRSRFLRDVRDRIKEVTTRDYINPEENTLDYVIIFIPNDQVYAFINENDREIIDEALRKKVVLCSPLTLYAILAVVRQAVDNFRLEQSASKILALMGAFNRQWGEFVETMDKMGRKLEDAQREYASLVTTRRNKLEKPLGRIEELRREKGISMEPLSLGGENPAEKETSA